jgi:class 3 adenylate cyclase
VPYAPKLTDTSHTQLDAGVLQLVEQLARHAHDTWVARRLEDGWRWGREPSDTEKLDPRLVAFDELPDPEKAAARAVATETVGFMRARGYQIILPARDGPSTSGTPAATAEIEGLLRMLCDAREGDLPSLLACWQARNPTLWSERPELYRLMAERLLRLGAPLVAYDVASEALSHCKEDVRLRHLQGLSLARSGAPSEANRLLTRLYADGNTDEETCGILARTYKDLWSQSTGDAARTYLERASDAYAEAYRESGGYWTGINVATLDVLRGEHQAAKAVAADVRERCEREIAALEADDPGRYWPVATLAEALLILGEVEEATRRYAEARRVAGKDYGSLSSTRRQALLLAEALGTDRAMIERSIPVPPVVVFSGHMIDRPERESPRFPAALEREVRGASRAQLAPLGPVIAYASAACGSDLIFLETVLELGGVVHVVLPYDRDDFVRDSVEVVPGSGWRARFDAVLARSAQVLTVSPQRMSHGLHSYEYANQILIGLARLHADQLDGAFVPLVVWDGQAGDGPGGTESVVACCRELGIEPRRVDLADLTARVAVSTGRPQTIAVQPSGVETGDAARIMALLFADVRHFSKLGDHQIPAFVDAFLGAIGDLTKHSPDRPVAKNTWGDGLYFVFERVGDAARFALQLRDRLRSADWSEHGLPPDLSIRIALHAGPVYRCIDPVTDHVTYTGTHVSRAARIEPITPPGHVYTSLAFAALLRLDRSTEFTCDYVGETPLAKGFGTFPTYHLSRR